MIHIASISSGRSSALLRHTEKGVQRPMTLRELRERHEAGTSASIHVVSEPGCNTCGIGSLVPLKRPRKGHPS